MPLVSFSICFYTENEEGKKKPLFYCILQKEKKSKKRKKEKEKKKIRKNEENDRGLS